MDFIQSYRIKVKLKEAPSYEYKIYTVAAQNMAHAIAVTESVLKGWEILEIYEAFQLINPELNYHLKNGAENV